MDIVNIEISDIVDEINVTIQDTVDIITIDVLENVDIINIDILENIDIITIGIQDVVDIITIEVSDIGLQGIQGIQGVAGNVTEIVASENIPAFNIINGDGTVSDSSIINKRDKAIGISTSIILNGFSGDVISFGEVVNPLWNWSIGSILYLNGNNISTTAPGSGFIQIIGVATASTKINLNINNTILI